jgi:N-acyl-D-aspartate/D-glutamate deacylase
MAEFDIVIRGGTVVDGTGAPARTADIAITDGRIVEVGQVHGTATRTIKADGATVTPGFVDVHAHYDGQVTWDSLVAPSSWHGVTTVVNGNCGVGFAPVKPTDHQQLIELMEGVEDIPGAALHEGLRWNWQSFPEYLDAIEQRPHDIDIAMQVPHGALRLFVMGQRGADREVATADEIVEMGRIAREAIEAGALGFTTSRTMNHKTVKGEFTPTLNAARDELVGIASAIGEAQRGVLEVVSDFAQPDELDTILAMAEASGRPLSISVAQADVRPQKWRSLMAAIAEGNDRGLAVTAQVAARPVGLLLGLQATINPLDASATARALKHLPLAERVAALTAPDVRASVLAELGEGRLNWARTFVLGDPPDYEPGPERSVAARAAAAGVSAPEHAFDELLADGGRGFLYIPFLNYSEGNLDAVREMLLSEHSVLGLADGGAHVGTICDASFPTTMLTHWVRDRTRGPRLPLEHVVAKQTMRTARMVGLTDRGVIAPGMKADVNVIDLPGLRLHRPTMSFDLPAGGKRLLQRVDGYLHTFVSGVETYAAGQHTGALPGRLVRGTR